MTSTRDIWRRPEGPGAPPYPQEYDRFQGKRPLPDGRVPTFWIRDATPDQLDELSHLMETEFLTDEQMSVSLGLVEEEESIADFRRLWREIILEQRVCLVAMTVGPDGREHVAGCNLLGVARATDTPLQMKGEGARLVFDAMNLMTERADVFRRFGVDRFLNGLGLSVARAYRGHDVGLRLLLARRPLCAALGLQLTVTVFSGAGSQRQSQKAGFQVVDEIVYADYRVDGRVVFANTTWPCAQLKVLYYGEPRDEEDKAAV